MVVKNESTTIQKVLETVKRGLSRWKVFDLGSADGTARVVQECLREIPGQMVTSEGELKDEGPVLWIGPQERLLPPGERVESEEMARLERGGDGYRLGVARLRMGQLELALQAFEKKAEGSDEEAYHAQYLAGAVLEMLGLPTERVLSAYCKAHRMRAERAEPLFRLAEFYIKKGNHFLGFLVSRFGQGFAAPKEGRFVEKSVYEMGLKDQYALCCKKMGRALYTEKT